MRVLSRIEEGILMTTQGAHGLLLQENDTVYFSPEHS